MDAISLQRLSPLHPALRAAILAADAELAPQGIVCRVTQGLRTSAEQQALWQQGRDEHGVIVAPKLVVTHAQAGYSAHNFGLAVDMVPGVRGAEAWEPNWNPAHPDFQAMVRCCEAHGLIAGMRWGEPKTDPDHFQLAEFPVTPTPEMRTLLAGGGLGAVWGSVVDPLAGGDGTVTA